MASAARRESAAQETQARDRAPATRATRRRVRRPDQFGQGSHEKEKVSITLDRSLVAEIRAQAGGRALSASVNELLQAALAAQRLAQLVEEMEQEAGPPSAEAFDRVLAQWFGPQ